MICFSKENDATKSAALGGQKGERNAVRVIIPAFGRVGVMDGQVPLITDVLPVKGGHLLLEFSGKLMVSRLAESERVAERERLKVLLQLAPGWRGEDEERAKAS
jgi:hypothetical protein